MQVTEETGCKVSAHSPHQTVIALAEAMVTLTQDTARMIRMGEAGRRRAMECFGWTEKGTQINELYRRATEGESLALKRVRLSTCSVRWAT